MIFKNTEWPDSPFGQLDPVQQYRREQQERELQRMLARQERERVEEARRAILERAEEALL